jgi:hypothetical protein
MQSSERRVHAIYGNDLDDASRSSEAAHRTFKLTDGLATLFDEFLARFEFVLKVFDLLFDDRRVLYDWILLSNLDAK